MQQVLGFHVPQALVVQLRLKGFNTVLPGVMRPAPEYHSANCPLLERCERPSAIILQPRALLACSPASHLGNIRPADSGLSRQGEWTSARRTWLRPRAWVDVRALALREGQLLRHAMLIAPTTAADPT